jgi:hypothetical protein
VHIVPRWIIKKQRINGNTHYVILRRWLWMTKFYGQFDSKKEALEKLEKIVYPNSMHGP